eukprot:4320932-Lingulodinium_polyedra.AAC.1
MTREAATTRTTATTTLTPRTRSKPQQQKTTLAKQGNINRGILHALYGRHFEDTALVIAKPDGRDEYSNILCAAKSPGYLANCPLALQGDAVAARD